MIRLAFPAALLAAASAGAQPIGAPGKLLLTNGITTLEGAAGGGLSPWAVIAGNATRNSIGAQAAVTAAGFPDFGFRSAAVAVGAWDRVELSYARQSLDTDEVGEALGLGEDFRFDQDVWGAKVKLAGDLVYGPNWLPAVAAGVQVKRSLDGATVRALGAAKRDNVDYYLSATKLVLGWSLLGNVTLRATEANQLGLLGASGKRRVQVEGSLAWQVSRRLAIGGEYRGKPDRLGIAREDDWWDAFAAYAITRNLSATLAWADLGSIATYGGQRGLLFQLQGSF